MDHGSHDPSPQVDAKKKSLRALERDQFDRAVFEAVQSTYDADDIVVLDEFGSNTNLTRRYGRAPRGERVYEDLPRTRPRNTTTIAALTTQGMGPALVVSGGVNRVTFETYIDDVLGPSLREGQIVVLDNASAHHGGRIAELLEKRGCRVWYLPAYSPDFSPIELAFSKVKAYLRSVKARTREALEEAIAQALASISSADARAFFAHCGFPLWPILDH